MRVIFLGKHKRSAARALTHLVETGWEVAAVVYDDEHEEPHPAQSLHPVVEQHGLSRASYDDLDPAGADLAVSFLYPRRIREPVISGPRLGTLNFHPAPLPDMRGLGGINVAIVEGLEDWGVSCHYVDESFDTGDLVQVDRFPLDPERATALSLDLESQDRLFELFRRVVDDAAAGRELPRTPQGEGRYVSREEYEAMRLVRPGDDVERKLRAFWYPPHPGAQIELDGRRYTLVDERLLAQVGAALRDAGQVA